MLNRNGQTLTCAFSMALDSAPASKLIHGAVRLSSVRQMIPKRDSARAFSTSTLHRAPFWMSSEETYGSMDWITSGSHSLKASATSWLTAPDQLTKTFIV